MTRARVGSVLALASAALLLAGCAGAPAPSATTPVPAPSITPQAGTGPQGETPAAAEVPTCDNMLPESLIKQYKSMGWTAQQNALYAADAPLEGSIQCTWGDYSTSSDAVQIYAFSPIDDTTAATMQDYLVAQGWTKEQDGDTVYITAGDRSPARDENGYGMTYKFAAGYVTYADTKQALLLISWPR